MTSHSDDDTDRHNASELRQAASRYATMAWCQGNRHEKRSSLCDRTRDETAIMDALDAAIARAERIEAAAHDYLSTTDVASLPARREHLREALAPVPDPPPVPPQ